ncbi:MAG TPA: L,D-transpeptidase [Candidatus Saccharimonadales bacterium]|nr:L,D-transpeptidase [Candidatus Saccharimonadales bacterium]
MRAQRYATTNYLSQRQAPKPKRHFLRKFATFAVLLALLGGGGWAVYQHNLNKKSQAAATQAAAVNHCAGVSGQLLLISISERHLWACDSGKQVYDSPVVTGMQRLEADLTPLGTYHIYAKQTNQTLTGSDSTGTWNDFAYYWEPFLSNQYGVYGFHDATWRKTSEFGNIDPNSMNGSHGCVELPLGAAKWIYDWSVVGTAVTVVA